MAAFGVKKAPTTAVTAFFYQHLIDYFCDGHLFVIVFTAACTQHSCRWLACLFALQYAASSRQIAYIFGKKG